MNRIILVGNGFDLAHNLKTGYNDFIKWYIKQCMSSSLSRRFYSDAMIDIQSEGRLYHFSSLDEYFDILYEKGLLSCLNAKIQINPMMTVGNPLTVRIKSELLQILLQKCTDVTWVEVENEYYALLKRILKRKDDQVKSIESLNSSLAEIIKQLESYLITQSAFTFNSNFEEIFSSKIQGDDFIPNLGMDRFPTETLVLNFNYTATIEPYLERDWYRHHYSKPTINYIHGKLKDPDNPMIFGFGDELDENYQAMELSTTKGFLKYIKSFWYFKTSNYQNLLRFIRLGAYQIVVLGHSCGLSDRTLLNMLFEDDNCKSIRLYYYEKQDGKYNNYEDLTHEISRHFKDKLKMRRIIVPEINSYSIPQINLDNL